MKFNDKLYDDSYSINFLKYQPPPKNLDHLQRSAVYKMIHEMEPPPKGISTRTEKILAAEDYLKMVKYDVSHILFLNTN